MINQRFCLRLVHIETFCNDFFLVIGTLIQLMTIGVALAAHVGWQCTDTEYLAAVFADSTPCHALNQGSGSHIHQQYSFQWLTYIYQ